MQKVISFFRKLIGSGANGKSSHGDLTKIESVTTPSMEVLVEDILAETEAAVINILVHSLDKRAIEQFVIARDRMATSIVQADIYIFNKIVGSRIFDSMVAPIYKDLSSNFVFENELNADTEILNNLKKLFISMLYKQPYEMERAFLLDMQLQRQLLQTLPLLRSYIKYIFGSFYNYACIGESAKHIDFYTAALKSILTLVHNCDSEELATFASCFSQVYPGYIPICTDNSLKEPMVLFRQLTTFLLPEQQGESGIIPLQPLSAPGEKIRLGHLRHNFTEEVHYLLAPIDKLDKNKFDITIFAFDTTGLEEVKNRYPELKYEILNMQNMSLSINKIREAKIDILINGTPLNGWGLEPHSKALSKRVANIQCLWCADIVTSGIESMDYWLVGEEYRCLGLEEQLSEKPYFIEGIGYYMPRIAHQPIPFIEARKQLNLRDSEIVYLSTAHIIKLNPELLSTWLRIIKAVDSAHLVLAPYGSAALTKKMLRRLEKPLNELCKKIGVERERIIISEASGPVAMRTLIDACDVYLDCFPYSGPTSTTEPLLVGKPVVALDGKTFRANFTAGILRSVQLSELIGEDIEDYIAKAIRLGLDKEFRKGTSNKTLEVMKSATYLDVSLVAAHLEKALVNLTEQHRSN